MQPSKPHNIGVIGTGKIAGNAHLPSYAWGANSNVVALADKNPEVLKAQGEKWQVRHTFTDYRRLLELPEVEVVDVAVNTDQHKAVVLDALAHGKHVLCQKPLADNLNDALELVEAADKHGLILAVNQNARWVPSYRRCGELLREGAIGEPILTVFEDHYWTEHHPYELERDWFLLLKNTIHKIDLLRSWFPEEPVGLFAQTIKAAPHPALGESVAVLHFSYGNGHQVNLIDDGASSSPGFRRILIHGTEGALRLDEETLESFKKVPGVRSNWQPIEVEGKRKPHAFYGVMAALLIALERGELPEHHARDNLKSLQLVFAAYESAATGNSIKIS